MTSDSDRGSQRVETALAILFVFALVVVPALASLEIISGWTALAVLVALSAVFAVPMLWLRAKDERTTVRGVARRLKWEPTNYPRRRGVMIGLVVLLLVGGYAPPFTTAVWRRALGAVSGAVILAMSIAAHRGALDDPDGRVVPTDRSLVLWGELVGVAVLVGWAANLVN